MTTSTDNQSESAVAVHPLEPLQVVPVVSVQPKPIWADSELIEALVNGNSPSLNLLLVLAILGVVAYIVKLAKQE